MKGYINLTHTNNGKIEQVKQELIDYINAHDGGEIQIVETLPTASAETYFNDSKTIYMVRNTSTSGDNYYDEYITIRTGEESSYTYSWEHIGSTQIDLSNYVQKTQTIAGVDLQDDITKAEMRTALDIPDAGKNVTIENGLISATGTKTAQETTFEVPFDNLNKLEVKVGSDGQTTLRHYENGSSYMVKLPKWAGVLASINQIFPTFSESSTYAVGDLVSHDDLFFRCVNAVTTPGVWNASDWEPTRLVDELGDKANGVIQGTVAPTTSTVGIVGDFYLDTVAKKLYQCVAVTTESDVTSYEWQAVGGGMEVLSGTTLPNGIVEGQVGQLYIATKSGTLWFCFGSYAWTNIGGSNDNSNKDILGYGANKIAIGTDLASGNYSVAIGSKTSGYNETSCAGNYSVALGTGASVASNKLHSYQIGAGTNSTSNTLQVKSDNIYKTDTHTLTVQNIQLNGTDINTVIDNKIASAITTALNTAV